MKIAAIADVHVHNHPWRGGPVDAGINRRCALCLDVLVRACLRADQLDCGALVVAGDLFDSVTPEPQVIASVQRCFATFSGHTFIMKGNHDMVSTADGDHALGPLHVPGSVTLVDGAEIHVDCVGNVALWMVPFQPGDARTYIPALLKTAKPYNRSAVNCKRKVLFIHAGVKDQETAAFLRASPDSIDFIELAEIAREYGFSAVFAGNWHRRKLWSSDEAVVMQIGALVPTGFDNPGLEGYGTLAIYDSDADTVDYEELPGPRFVTVSDEKSLSLDNVGDNQLFVRIRASSAGIHSAQAWLQEQMDSHKVQGGEVLLDKAESEAAARSAAHAARVGETIEESINNYIKTMDLPAGVDRDEVLTRVRGFMKGA